VVEARDRYTIHHAERVGLFAREIGIAAALPDLDLGILYLGGVLHDLGKVTLPDSILNKPGPLDTEETAIMRLHARDGERICMPLRSAGHFLPIIRHHHERVDGAGYPDHLAGDSIPLGARIAAIGDAWDAMTSDRPYRAALSLDEATSRLRAGAGTQWDAEHTDLFLQLLDRGVDARVRVTQDRAQSQSSVESYLPKFADLQRTYPRSPGYRP
jgi:putative two-component system response regulator